MSSHRARQALARLLEAEDRQGGDLPRAADVLLADLAESWEPIWLDLLGAGGGSNTVYRIVAGVRDPDATRALGELVERHDRDLLLRTAALIALARSRTAEGEALLLERVAVDPVLRRPAARELGAVAGPLAAIGLALKLEDEDPIVRRDVAAGLARCGDGDAVGLLLDVVHRESDRVAAAALGELGIAPALPELLGLLHDPRPEHRVVAVGGIGTVGDSRAVPVLLGSLQDDAPEVRHEALDAIESVTGARPVGLAQIDDAELFVRLTRLWWSRTRARLHYRTCYRYGEPRSLRHWIDDLAQVWRAGHRPERVDAAHARLTAATGVSFGFDAYALDDAANDAALRAWTDWWQRHAARFPAGRWYWQGEALADPVRWP